MTEIRGQTLREMTNNNTPFNYRPYMLHCIRFALTIQIKHTYFISFMSTVQTIMTAA